MTHRLYELLQELDRLSLWYRLDRHRPDTVMVTVTAVGERLEVDVFEDGHIEFSRFSGDEGCAGGCEELLELLACLAADESPGTS